MSRTNSPIIYVNFDHVCDSKVISATWKPEPTEKFNTPYVHKEEVDKFSIALRKAIRFMPPGDALAELIHAGLSRLELGVPE